MTDYQKLSKKLLSFIAQSYKAPEDERRRLLIEKLLDHTSFSELEAHKRPQPFDDPLVGAFLLDGNGKVLGAHRKVKQQERHAEPNAIIAALCQVDTNEAKDLVNQINKAYEDKSWLTSQAAEIAFEDLFLKSGDLIRRHFNVDDLHLYSSLEPCRDYESQPSCSKIISALGVSEVIYGSDDLNDKGLGRDVLEAEGIQVFPNIDIEKSTKINALFFYSLYLNQLIFRDNKLALFERPFPYSVFRTDKTNLKVEIGKNGRMRHVPFNPPLLRSYSAAPFYNTDMISVSDSDMAAIRNASADFNLVLQCGDLSASTLAKILADIARTSSSTPAVPGVIATSRNPFTSDKDEGGQDSIQKQLHSWIEDSKIDFHPGAFQKLNEIADARRAVFIGSLRKSENEAIYALFKLCTKKTAGSSTDESTEYCHFFGSCQDILNGIQSLKATILSNTRVSRLTLFFQLEAQNEVTRLIRNIQQERHFEKEQLLEKASITIEVLGNPEEKPKHETFVQFLATTLSKLDISNRLKEQKYFSWPEDVATLLKHYFEAQEGRDPRFFSARSLQSLGRARNWEDRAATGALITAQAKVDHISFNRTVLDPLFSLVNNEFNDENWARACVLLNSLRSCRDQIAPSENQKIRKLLILVANKLDLLLEKKSDAPWLIDVIWRWTASAFDYLSSGEMQHLGKYLTSHISDSPFLLSECYQYWLQGLKKNADPQSFTKIFGAENWSSEASKSLAVRVSRLISRRPISISSSYQKQLWSDLRSCLIAFKSKGCWKDYELERRRVKAVLTNGLFSPIPNTGEETVTWANSNLFPTFVSQQLLSSIEGASIFGILPAVQKERQKEKKWRSDAHDICINALSDLPVNWRCDCITALCGDSDASIRLASLRVALNLSHNVEHFGFENSKLGQHQLASFREQCIRTALKHASMYWVDRAILEGLAGLIEHVQTTEDQHQILCPDLLSCGIGPLLHRPAQLVHPELSVALKHIHTKSQKVLLVLPPILWPEEATKEGEVRLDGTPPIGLGQIGSALSARGHQVTILDAHRYMVSLDEVHSLAEESDVVGISVVTSTLNSTEKLCRHIREFGRRDKGGIDIVLGGHAISLLGADISSMQTASFDALVAGPGEAAFAEIVERNIEEPAPSFIQPNIYWKPKEGKEADRSDGFSSPTSLKKTRTLAARKLAKDWNDLPWVRRNLYQSQNGDRYEPIVTRDGHHLEAHILSSTGCNWACAFCTEAIIHGEVREVRRSAKDVIAEIRFLLKLENVNRVQFVDDNIFPSGPIGAKKEQAKLWVLEFLSGMDSIKKDVPNFSWRGLFRLDDLRLYERLIPNLYQRMADCGCSLLAVGIEYGNEDLRQREKGSLPGVAKMSNAAIGQMLKSIRASGIFTKAYFILGGPNETKETAEETIQFALKHDISVAYFAIYKQFRKIQKSKIRENEIPSFSILDMSFLDLDDFSFTENEMIQCFGKKYSVTKLNEIEASINHLKSEGFKFRKLFKYNDYHDDHWDNIYSINGTQGSDEYIKLVRRAYLEFFCRPEWTKTYQELVASGY